MDALLERLDPVFERRGTSDVAIATNGGFAASADHPADERRGAARQAAPGRDGGALLLGKRDLSPHAQEEPQPEARPRLATATRMLASHRLIGMFGHVSVLTEDPQRYLVCPGAGARKDRCRSTDVLELGLDDEFEPGRPLELYMHSEVHRLKPHIKSLIHVHSPALVALSAMARGAHRSAHAARELLARGHARLGRGRPGQGPGGRAAADRDPGRCGDRAAALARRGDRRHGRCTRPSSGRSSPRSTPASWSPRCRTVGRWLRCRASTDRDDLYARVLSARTHDMHWDYASSFVTVAPGARGQD